jgi:hypothetical protein
VEASDSTTTSRIVLESLAMNPNQSEIVGREVVVTLNGNRTKSVVTIRGFSPNGRKCAPTCRLIEVII